MHNEKSIEAEINSPDELNADGSPIEAQILQPGDEFYDLMKRRYRELDRAALDSGVLERERIIMYFNEFSQRGFRGLALLRLVVAWTEESLEIARTELDAES